MESGLKMKVPSSNLLIRLYAVRSTWMVEFQDKDRSLVVTSEFSLDFSPASRKLKSDWHTNTHFPFVCCKQNPITSCLHLAVATWAGEKLP